MEQSLGNSDSHPTPKTTQTESDAIRTMLQHALGIETDFYEEAFLADDTITFVVRPEYIIDEDDFSDLPDEDEDADWLFDEGMEFLGLTGDEDEQGFSDSYWDSIS